MDKDMDKDDLLERYEALGQEDDFIVAKPLFEQALHEKPDAVTHRQYGYLLFGHGRNAIRRAAEQYERSIALDPGDDKVRLMWISAKAALDEPDDAIAVYGERVAAAPGDARELRFFSAAYLAAKDFDAAREVIDAGLALAPDSAALISYRGDVKAAMGDPEGALADWRRAVELDPENQGPVYSSAFLLEGEGRLAEAAAAWQHIVDYCDERGWDLTAAWPRQELQRIRALLAGP
jgi:tetratricopeptide (TPR) repeat protein